MARLSPPPPAGGALRARTPLSLARHLPTLWGVTLAEGAKKVNSGCRTDTRCFSYNLLHFQLAAAGVHADAEHNADAEIHHDDA